jgi:hypothetical protein
MFRNIRRFRTSPSWKCPAFSFCRSILPAHALKFYRSVTLKISLCWQRQTVAQELVARWRTQAEPDWIRPYGLPRKSVIHSSPSVSRHMVDAIANSSGHDSTSFCFLPRDCNRDTIVALFRMESGPVSGRGGIQTARVAGDDATCLVCLFNEVIGVDGSSI